MKKITKLTVCALLIGAFFTAFTPTARAAAPPESLPLTLRALEAFALEQTAFIQVYAWSSGQINTAGTTNSLWIPYVKVNGMVNERDVLKIIANARLRIGVLRTNDYVGFSAYVYDKNGNVMFSGGNSGTLMPSTGPVSLNLFPVKMRMSDDVVFALPNVVGAYIAERNPNGEIVEYYNIPVQQDGDVGRFHYFAYFGDKFGELVLSLDDGTQVAYDLHNRGRKITPKIADVAASSVTAPGHYYAEDVSQVWVAVTQQEFDDRISPLLQYVNSGTTNRPVFLGSDLPSMESHASLRIWRQGTSAANAEVVTLTEHSPWSQKSIGPGYWWIEFFYPSGFGIDSNQYFPPYGGNGGESDGGSGGAVKGKAETEVSQSP